MQYHHVCLESFGYCLPEEVLSSDELENQLQPLYSRLRLPEGRLELMTGIAERRIWKPGTLPSDKSILSAQRAIEASGLDPARIGALIHASVCRDHLEPATACRVHHALGLPADCVVYDVSNACLGLLNGVLQLANMIELGQIQAGLVVGSEGSRQLLETTVASLNARTELTRQQIKLAVASLTIGSGSCAILLTDRETSTTGNRLTAASLRAHSQHHALCQSGQDEAGSGMQPLMTTDSETLMREGIAAGQQTFERFQRETGWSCQDIDASFCHQVGVGHRKLMLDTLGVSPQRDFSTMQWLGNTGSVALPLTMAIGVEAGHVRSQQRLALLGIGSGINCLMIGVDWRIARVGCSDADRSLARAKTAQFLPTFQAEFPTLRSSPRPPLAPSFKVGQQR